MLYCTYTYRRIVVPSSYHPSGFVKCWSSISAHSRYHTIASCCLGHLHLLICTTMSSCSSTGSSLLLVCASVFTRATPETSFLDLRHVRESNRQAGQAVRQSDSQTKKLPRGNAAMTASCTVISGASARAFSSRSLPVKTWPSRSHFLAGTRYFNLLHNHPCTCTLHQPASLVSVCHYLFLFSCMDHGPWLSTLTVHYSFTAAWKGKIPGRVAIPHREHACHLQLPTHLDRWYAWGRHFILLR